MILNEPPADLVFLEPWMQIPDSSKDAFVLELAKEVCEQHVLHGKEVVAIALRGDCDDVLFATDDPTEPLAVVHLTWTGRIEPNPAWPSATLYDSWQDWIDRCMKPDHEEYDDRG